MTRIAFALLLALPLAAFAQEAADEAVPAPVPAAANAPATQADVADAAQELANLHQRMQELEGQVTELSGTVETLQSQQEAAAQFQAQQEAITERGAVSEEARIARTQAMDGLGQAALAIDAQLALGATGMERPIAQMEGSIAALEANASQLSGRYEVENLRAARASTITAGVALNEGNFYGARNALNDVVVFLRSAQDAAITNVKREWTGQ
jgi:TolA-binding protein